MKKILILSGTHGNEHSAVELGLKLKTYCKEYFSNVKIIPFVNQTGLEANSREAQSYSSYDLNRSFHEEDDSYDTVISKIKDFILEADIVIDIHNSHRCANFCLVDRGLNEQTIKSICYEADVEYATRFSTGGTIKDYVNQLGKIGITYEFSGMQTLNNRTELSLAYDDIISLINVCSTESEKAVHQYNPHILESMHCLETGFIDFLYDINDIVEPDEPIFNVINNENEIIETVLNEQKSPIKLIALSPSFQTRGSIVLQYIIKD